MGWVVKISNHAERFTQSSAPTKRPAQVVPLVSISASSRNWIMSNPSRHSRVCLLESAFRLLEREEGLVGSSKVFSSHHDPSRNWISLHKVRAASRKLIWKPCNKTAVNKRLVKNNILNHYNDKEIIMKNQIVKLGVSLAALVGLALPSLANAQSCSTWASNVIAQLQSNPNMGAMIATNLSDGRYVSYAAYPKVGTPLTHVPAHQSGFLHFPDSLQGAISQFFSDRTYDFNGGLEPFNPAATDSLGVTIWLGYGGFYTPGVGYSITPGRVTFTLYSWGNAIVSFTPERCDGMIYGLSGNEGILLSLFPMQKLN